MRKFTHQPEERDQDRMDAFRPHKTDDLADEWWLKPNKSVNSSPANAAYFNTQTGQSS